MSDELKRPECFDFAMDFVGDPEESIIRNYVEQLEARAALVSQRPTDGELENWHTECADLTRLGAAEHYWAFEVSTDNLCAIAHAVLARFSPTP
jgi:hypothetical protein